MTKWIFNQLCWYVDVHQHTHNHSFPKSLEEIALEYEFASPSLFFTNPRFAEKDIGFFTVSGLTERDLGAIWLFENVETDDKEPGGRFVIRIGKDGPLAECINEEQFRTELKATLEKPIREVVPNDRRHSTYGWPLGEITNNKIVFGETTYSFSTHRLSTRSAYRILGVGIFATLFALFYGRIKRNSLKAKY